MAIPLSVIIKKLGLSAATNKKGRKIIVGIILGVLFLLSTPAMVLLGLFSGSMNIQTGDIQDVVSERKAYAEVITAQIAEEMLESGYEPKTIKEAQTVYAYILFEYGETDGFVQRLVACFETWYTDEILSDRINAEFDTCITAEELSAVLSDIRKEFEKEEETENEDKRNADVKTNSDNGNAVRGIRRHRAAV